MTPSDDEIVAWADSFIQEHAFNRPVACQIATRAAQWTRSKMISSPATRGLAVRFVDAIAADEKIGGFDLSAGMFGPALSKLVVELSNGKYANPCFVKADPEAPIFVLLPTDPLAPHAVYEWCRRYRSLHATYDGERWQWPDQRRKAKHDQAMSVANQMAA